MTPPNSISTGRKPSPGSPGPILLGAALSLLLVGCAHSGSTSETSLQSGAATQSAETPQSQEASQSPTTAAMAAAAGYTLASGAADFNATGEFLGTAKVGQLDIDVYLSGIAPSPRDGQWAEEEATDLHIRAGDPLVLLTFVATATDDPVELSADSVNLFLVYEGHPHYGGMEQIRERDLFAEHSIPCDTVVESVTDLVVNPGESFAFGTSIIYRPRTPLDIKLSYLPVDDSGSVLYADPAEGHLTVSVP